MIPWLNTTVYKVSICSYYFQRSIIYIYYFQRSKRTKQESGLVWQVCVWTFLRRTRGPKRSAHCRVCQVCMGSFSDEQYDPSKVCNILFERSVRGCFQMNIGIPMNCASSWLERQAAARAARATPFWARPRTTAGLKTCLDRILAQENAKGSKESSTSKRYWYVSQVD